MGKLIDLTGQRFERLFVIKRVYPNAKLGEPRWFCKCDCGMEKIILGSNLRQGITKSCGCLNKELAGNRVRLNPGLASMRAMMGGYKAGAKRRGLEFNLTEEQFKELTQKDCFYCGAKPNNISKHNDFNGEYIYNGLDRIDNKKGYMIDNVIPCCLRCNRAKGILTLQEYKNWISDSYNRIVDARGVKEGTIEKYFAKLNKPLEVISEEDLDLS